MGSNAYRYGSGEGACRDRDRFERLVYTIWTELEAPTLPWIFRVSESRLIQSVWCFRCSGIRRIVLNERGWAREKSPRSGWSILSGYPLYR
jgi:hypothetical protein